MTTTDNAADVQQKTPPAVEAVIAELENTVIQDHRSAEAEDTQTANDAQPPSPRPPIVYSRKELLNLSQSFLVKPPDEMPDFKSWFGEFNEQSLHASKKEMEVSSGNSQPRERRYRRDAEEEGLSRPPFRSALSQPSQMGNFKHQPLRANDRDRDAERDLRTLSDRFDRERGRGERLGLPSHSALLRNRDRDSAPHLVSDRDTQRLANRKRNGESNEDWRRGGEQPRSGRDEAHSRRERDDREPRVRESSRHRDSPPTTKRDREDHRRERDRERFVDGDDDARRWRDDGRRDERMTARRDKDRLDREKDKGRDRSREAGDNDRDSRDGWTVAEEKGGRRGGRDRRQDDAREKDDRREREKEKEPAWMETYVPPSSSAGGILGGKGAEGEMDSIQAWKMSMKRQAEGLPPVKKRPETTPTEAETENIDSWKKNSAPAIGRKKDAAEENDLNNKALATEPSPHPNSHVPKNSLEKSQSTKASFSATEAQLDEIQLFKLMMKQEEKKRAANNEVMATEERISPNNDLKPVGNSNSGLMRIREGHSTGEGPPTSLADIAPITTDPLATSKSDNAVNAALLGMSKAPSPHSAQLTNSQSVTSASLSVPIESTGPRIHPSKTSESFLSNNAPPALGKEASSQSVFDPPRQSRLLAFGAQSSKPPAQPTPHSASTLAQLNRLQQSDPQWPVQRRLSVSPIIPQHTNSLQSSSDRVNALGNQYDAGTLEGTQRRPGQTTLASHGMMYENGARAVDSRDLAVDLPRAPMSANTSDRASFIAQTENLQHLSDLRRHPTPPSVPFNATSPISPFDSHPAGNQSSYSSGKGSRMAKHFERARDPSQSTNTNRANNTGLGLNGGIPSRQEHQLSNMTLGPPESRNIQDLLTMLNNSAQAQRAQQLHGLNAGLGTQQTNQSLHLGPSGPLGRLDINDPDEGRFAPDGLVPGLRPAPTSSQRNRDINNGSMYPNQLEDMLAFNNRQQRAAMEQLLGGSTSSQFNSQGPNLGRGGLGLQHQGMRGGPSPINNFNPVQPQPQQRLPPGLANLGARPPHEPSQFLGGGVGAGNFSVPNQLHAGLQHGNGPQTFNQFQGPGTLGGLLGNQNALRGQPNLAQLGAAPLNGLGGIDYRGGPGGPTPNHVLGLGGPNGGQAMRGGPGLPSQQLHGLNQVPPNMGLRQQQGIQQQLMPQMLPPQLQQHGLQGGQHNPADLMALLMGNAHRE